MYPARIAASDGVPRYERHQPEKTHSKNRRGHPDPEIWVVRHPGGFEPQSDRGPLHFHMLVLDGAYVENDFGACAFTG